MNIIRNFLDSLKKLLIFFCLSGCITTESWEEFGNNLAEYNSVESQCQRLRSEIMRGTKEGAFDSLGDFWVNDSYTLNQVRKERQAQRIIAYKTALESYKTLCK